MRYIFTTAALMGAIWFGFYAADNEIGHFGALVTAFVAYGSGRFSHVAK